MNKNSVWLYTDSQNSHESFYDDFKQDETWCIFSTELKAYLHALNKFCEENDIDKSDHVDDYDDVKVYNKIQSVFLKIENKTIDISEIKDYFKLIEEEPTIIELELDNEY